MKHPVLEFFTLIILSSLVLLHSCAPTEDEPYPCKNSAPQYYTLTAAQKAIIPYTGYDTISMVSNTGDTIHCIGTGKQYFNTMEFEENSHPECAGFGAEKFYEAYKIEFVDSVKSIKIEVAHYFYHVYNDKIRYDDVGVVFKGGGFFITDFHLSKESAQNYFGDVIIQNSMYKAVNKVKNYDSLNDSLSFMLINKTNGIIKIQLNENEKWELLPD